MPEDNTPSYKEHLSEYGANIFQDPFSELTHNRQINLLVVSVVAIALSSPLVTVSGLSAGGVDVTVRSPEIMQQVGGWATIYFLAAYILCIIQDRLTYQYKGLPTHVNMVETLSEQTLNNHTKSLENSRKVNEISQESRLLWDKIKAIDEKYQGSGNDSQRYKEHQPILAQLRELGLRADAFRKAEIDPLGKEGEVIGARLSLAVKLQSQARLLRYFRTSIEIAFPICMAIFAIWFALKK